VKQSVNLCEQTYSVYTSRALPVRAGPGSKILKNHRAGPGRAQKLLGRAQKLLGRAGPVSIRPVKLAGSLTCNVSVVNILPLRGRPAFFLPYRCKLSITSSQIVFWFVSSRPRNRIGPGRAGPGWACIFLQCTGPGRTFFGPGRA